jgi:hypothetical protein
MWKGLGRHHREGNNLMSVSAMVKRFMNFSFSNQDEQNTEKATPVSVYYHIYTACSSLKIPKG